MLETERISCCHRLAGFAGTAKERVSTAGGTVCDNGGAGARERVDSGVGCGGTVAIAGGGCTGVTTG